MNAGYFPVIFKKLWLSLSLALGISLAALAQDHCVPYRAGHAERPIPGKGISPRGEISIPLVFHIVWRDSAENIPDWQILSQLDVLNRDYNALNADLAEVPAAFRDRIGSVGFRFCLAAVDPQGNPTTAITRTKTNIDQVGVYRDAQDRRAICYEDAGGADAWDPSRYLNIWIGDMGGRLGSSSFPGIGPPEEDGVIVDPKFTGTTGLAFSGKPNHLGRTLTHEIGHYFDLEHIWGPGSGSCDVDDGISDTPKQEGPYYGCPSYPQGSCGELAMFMNFMDYCDDACLLLFTQGQCAHMQAAQASWRSELPKTPVQCRVPDPAADWKIELWPNPSSGYFNCRVSDAGATHFSLNLLDLLGRSIPLGEWANGEIRGIDLKGYPAGLYLLQVSQGGSYRCHKLIITH